MIAAPIVLPAELIKVQIEEIGEPEVVEPEEDEDVDINIDEEEI